MFSLPIQVYGIQTASRTFRRLLFSAPFGTFLCFSLVLIFPLCPLLCTFHVFSFIAPLLFLDGMIRP